MAATKGDFDRINKIVRIGGRYPANPVNPVKKNKKLTGSS